MGRRFSRRQRGHKNSRCVKERARGEGREKNHLKNALFALSGQLNQALNPDTVTGRTAAGAASQDGQIEAKEREKLKIKPQAQRSCRTCWRAEARGEGARWGEGGKKKNRSQP